MIYFSDDKLKCKGKNCCGGARPHNPSFEYKLDRIRADFGKPLFVTSGYRCPVHNKKVGGVSNSLHTKMRAVDVTTGRTKDLLTISEIAKKYCREVIIYHDLNFVHIGDE